MGNIFSRRKSKYDPMDCHDETWDPNDKACYGYWYNRRMREAIEEADRERAYIEQRKKEQSDAIFEAEINKENVYNAKIEAYKLRRGGKSKRKRRRSIKSKRH